MTRLLIHFGYSPALQIEGERSPFAGLGGAKWSGWNQNLMGAINDAVASQERLRGKPFGSLEWTPTKWDDPIL
jgi:hypothetical protein